jgi:phage terminase large subunit-like protein
LPLPKGLTITADDVRRELDRRKYNRIDTLFPDQGEFRRELYVKHIQVIADTAQFRQVCMLSGNRVGKTEVGTYIAACHLMGEYPHWWTGKRFDKPVSVIAAGETSMLVRDSLQEKLLGSMIDVGSGLIRKDRLHEKPKMKMGMPNAVDSVYVKHSSGGLSLLQFQSYDQGREKFQATARHLILLDEEPPLEIYLECLLRTMTTNGTVLSTFTPLKGVSHTVLHIQQQERDGLASIVRATWDDAPHLTEEDKNELMASLPPHQRDARSKGVPALGSGAVYQVPEADVVIDDFPIPDYWDQVYGMDVGWNNTAVVWIAYNRDYDMAYLIGEYKRGQCEPAVHVQAIKAQGEVPGVIDPASRGRNQVDGHDLLSLYRNLGLKLTEADNGVSAGLLEVYQRLSSGRLKIFRSCVKTLEEYRLYRRDEKGNVVKDNDHLMDAMRYGIMSGLSLAKPRGAINKRPMPDRNRGKF